MKKIGVFIVLIVIFAGVAYAYSFSDFLENMGDAFSKFFSLTGFVVLDIAKEASDVVDESPISIPEPPQVEAKEETTSSTDEGTEKESATSEVDGVTGNAESDSISKEDIDSAVIVPSCSDFVDNNINYFKKGICKDKNNDEFEDYCSSDGRSVMEYRCASGGICYNSWYVCSNGCEDGACLSTAVAELKPDLTIISVNNINEKLIMSVKNLGTKGTFFKTRILKDNSEYISDVNYYLDSGEIVDVDLGEAYFGYYSAELIADEDSNLENNKAQGNLIHEEAESVEETITGSAVTGESIENNGKTLNIWQKIIEFLRKLFV